MHKLTLTLLLVAVVSCGASSGELKAARDARYKADPATLFNAVKAATAINYKTVEEDPAALMLRTEARWYTPEGQADTKRGNNLARLQDNSINFSVVVRVVKADGDSYTVAVEPVALRLRGLTSKAEPLDMKDPEVPGWVHGKVESLQLGIHDRLKAYEVKGATVPAMVPAAPPAPPAAGSDTGSAAEPAPAAPPPATP